MFIILIPIGMGRPGQTFNMKQKQDSTVLLADVEETLGFRLPCYIVCMGSGLCRYLYHLINKYKYKQINKIIVIKSNKDYCTIISTTMCFHKIWGNMASCYSAL